MIRFASSMGGLSILAIAVGCSSTESSTANKAPAHAATGTVKAAFHVVTEGVPPINAAAVVGIIGSYHGCADQSDGGGSWVLDTADNVGAMETLTGLVAPSIELNDTNCTLQIDTIDANGTLYSGSGLVFTGPTATANTYLATAVGFDAPEDAGGALTFYANAQSTVTNAASNFSLTLLIGNQPNTGSSSATATAAVVTGSLSVSNVAAPNYTVDLTGFSLQDDAHDTVAATAGTINLDVGSQSGELYETFKGSDLSTSDFATIDSMFSTGSTGAIGIPAGGATVAITASSLVAVGDTLPETSTIVVQHVDSASQVATYEVLAITFNPHPDGG
jgi:hypothetical protein